MLSLYAYAKPAKMKLQTVLIVSSTDKYTDNARDLFSLLPGTSDVGSEQKYAFKVAQLDFFGGVPPKFEH